MPDGFDLTTDAARVAVLLRSLSELEQRRGTVLSKLHLAQEAAEAESRGYSAKLDSLYEDVERSGHTGDWILEAAGIVRQREFIERERFASQLAVLHQKLREPVEPDIREALERVISIGEAWIELPARLYKKLLQLAEQRRALASKVRHARPVPGEMESVELTRKIISRFPNILAELAK